MKEFNYRGYDFVLDGCMLGVLDGKGSVIPRIACVDGDVLSYIDNMFNKIQSLAMSFDMAIELLRIERKRLEKFRECKNKTLFDIIDVDEEFKIEGISGIFKVNSNCLLCIKIDLCWELVNDAKLSEDIIYGKRDIRRM